MTKKAKVRKKRKYRTKRIYYGPEGRETSMWWTVRLANAAKPVIINGSAAAALRAHRGVTVGCALSFAAFDSAKAFGHPVHLVAVTKSTLLAVDQLHKDGSPAHAVLYAHSYGKIIDGNDDGTLKKLVKEEPELMERPFNLRPPRNKGRPSGPNAGRTAYDKRGQSLATHRAYVPRGALSRAVKAGRIAKGVAQQLTEVAKKVPEQTHMEFIPAQ